MLNHSYSHSIDMWLQLSFNIKLNEFLFSEKQHNNNNCQMNEHLLWTIHSSNSFHTLLANIVLCYTFFYQLKSSEFNRHIYIYVYITFSTFQIKHIHAKRSTIFVLITDEILLQQRFMENWMKLTICIYGFRTKSWFFQKKK